MLLTIDGPEAAGKTTLADAVATRVRQHGWHVVHVRSRRPDDNPFPFYLDMIKLAAEPDRLVIMDRAWPSEFVYGDLLQRPTALSADLVESALAPAARWLGPTLIALPTVSDTLRQRRRNRGDASDLDVPVSHEYHAYFEYRANFGWGSVRTDDAEAVIRTSLNVDIELRAARNRIMSGLVPPHVAGNPYSKTVFVGERRNAGSSAPLAWAPFTSRNTRWLYDVVGRPYHRFAYTNAEDVLENAELEKFVRSRYRVVALGNAASKSMSKLNVVHEKLPHPAAVERWPWLRAARADYAMQVSFADEEARGA